MNGNPCSYLFLYHCYTNIFQTLPTIVLLWDFAKLSCLYYLQMLCVLHLLYYNLPEQNTEMHLGEEECERGSPLFIIKKYFILNLITIFFANKQKGFHSVCTGTGSPCECGSVFINPLFKRTFYTFSNLFFVIFCHFLAKTRNGIAMTKA